MVNQTSRLFCLILHCNFCPFSSQLVALGPDELGDWEKPKPEPKKKTKKTVEEKGDEEEEDEEEEGEEDRTKEVYEPRLTRRPRGAASGGAADPAPAGFRNKRKLTITPHRDDAAAQERRKRLRGAGAGTQPTLHQMGFGRDPKP